MPTSKFIRRSPAVRGLAALVSLASLMVLGGCGGQPTTAPLDPAEAPPAGVTVDEVLAQLTAAYRDADSYFDNAEYRETFLRQGAGRPSSPPGHQVSVAFERPNRYRITRRVPEVSAPALHVMVASDGEKLTALISDLPKQWLEAEPPAAAALNARAIAPDTTLRSGLFPVPLENLYPQLDLLLATEENPPRLLQDAEAKLLASRELAGADCYRVELTRPSGRYVLWIDPQTSTLRRVDMPTAALREELDPQGVMLDWRLWIDLRDATLGGTIARSVFQPKPPAGTEAVERFEPTR